MDQEQVQSTKGWPAPIYIKELQYFLGFANYNSRFIRFFSHVALPLIV